MHFNGCAEDGDWKGLEMRNIDVLTMCLYSASVVAYRDELHSSMYKQKANSARRSLGSAALPLFSETNVEQR